VNYFVKTGRGGRKKVKGGGKSERGKRCLWLRGEKAREKVKTGEPKVSGEQSCLLFTKKNKGEVGNTGGGERRWRKGWIQFGTFHQAN